MEEFLIELSTTFECEWFHFLTANFTDDECGDGKTEHGGKGTKDGEDSNAANSSTFPLENSSSSSGSSRVSDFSVEYTQGMKNVGSVNSSGSAGSAGVDAREGLNDVDLESAGEELDGEGDSSSTSDTRRRSVSVLLVLCVRGAECAARSTAVTSAADALLCDSRRSMQVCVAASLSSCVPERSGSSSRGRMLVSASPSSGSSAAISSEGVVMGVAYTPDPKDETLLARRL